MCLKKKSVSFSLSAILDDKECLHPVLEINFSQMHHQFFKSTLLLPTFLIHLFKFKALHSGYSWMK